MGPCYACLPKGREFIKRTSFFRGNTVGFIKKTFDRKRFQCLGFERCPSSGLTRHFRIQKGTGAETRPAIVSGTVTVEAPVSYLGL